MSDLVIYGDGVSGNCLKVKWCAARLGLDATWRETSVLQSATRTPEFLALNPAGQVPFVQFPDGEGLAQSNAIVLTLNERHGGDMLPAEPKQRAQVLQWLFWEQYSHEPSIAVRRFHKAFLGKDDDAIDPALKAKGDAALGLMNEELANRDFLVGAAFTLADLALVAYTRVADEGGFDLDEFPRVRDWVIRIEKILDIPAGEGRATN